LLILSEDIVHTCSDSLQLNIVYDGCIVKQKYTIVSYDVDCFKCNYEYLL